MTFLSILLILIIGFGILFLISQELAFFEYVGLSAPLGLGVVTVGMFLIDLVPGMLINRNSILGFCALILIALSCLHIYVKSWSKVPSFIWTWDWLKYNNLSIWPLLGLTVYMVYGISVKALFWPPFHADTIIGYDFLAKAIVEEGKIANSLFTDMPKTVSVRMTYTPLMPLGMSYFLFFGFTMAKVIQPVFLVSLFITLFGFLKKASNPLAAMVGCALLSITPEFMAQSAMQMTNMSLTFFTCGGVLALYLWHLGKGEEYFWLSCLVLTIGTWNRSEMLVYIAGAGLVLLYRIITQESTSYFSKSNMLKVVALIGPSFIIYIVWEWYAKGVLDATQFKQGFSLTQPEGKWGHMLDQVQQVTFSKVYYGEVIYIFCAVLVVILVGHFVIKRFNDWDFMMIVFSVLFTWMFYIVLYQFIYAGPELRLINIYITAGYKRGIFCFFPMMMFLIVASPVSRFVFDWLQPKPKILN